MTSILFLVLAFSDGVENADVTVLQTFETPSEVSEDYISIPTNMVFSKDGGLFLLDQTRKMIFSWDADGKFLRAFGGEGQGPGELLRPTAVNVTEKEVIVWDDREDMSVFDHEGKFLTRFPVVGYYPRTFTPLSGDKLLIGYRNTKKKSPQGHDHFSFSIINREGETLETIKSWPDLSNLAPNKDEERLKPYRPEVDIQKDRAGNIYIGFSQNTRLFRLDDEGEIVSQHDFEIPTGPPTEKEVEAYQNMSILKNGRRMKMVDPSTVDFDANKAYYTHFLIKGDKVVFTLTPFGGLWGVAGGYSEGSYYVADFASGKVETRGSYAYPEDSVVFYRNGRILACVVDKEGGLVISEITLRGL